MNKASYKDIQITLIEAVLVTLILAVRRLRKANFSLQGHS